LASAIAADDVVHLTSPSIAEERVVIGDRYQNRVALDFPGFGAPLLLQRTPKYLRFVKSLDGAWDALDQIEDSPSADEVVVVGVLDSWTGLHIDRVDPKTRRRGGEWHKMVTYKLPPSQPPSEVLRDNQRWQEWAMSQDQQQRASDG
jgi:hypothetical protein